MSKKLVFKDREVIPFDNRDGKIWFTGQHMAELLEYADAKSVNRLYNRNKDEFSSDMALVVNVTSCNKNNNLQNKKVRIFSLRGAHLLGMLADTKVAKALRKWLLDLAEKESESSTDLASLDMTKLKNMTVGEMQNRLVSADKWSFDNFGIKGSNLMNLRKRHLKKLRKAEKTIIALSQLTLPGFEDLENGENPA